MSHYNPVYTYTGLSYSIVDGKLVQTGSNTSQFTPSTGDTDEEYKQRFNKSNSYGNLTIDSLETKTVQPSIQPDIYLVKK
jgi:hypothetical protein